MKFNLRFGVAIQILLMCHFYKDQKITSSFLSSKIGADSAIIRQIMFDLKTANFIFCKPGPGGTTLNVDLSTISLLDVYKAVCDSDENLIKWYNTPSDATNLEVEIKNITNTHFESYKLVFFEKMNHTSVLDLCNSISSQLTNSD